MLPQTEGTIGGLLFKKQCPLLLIGEFLIDNKPNFISFRLTARECTVYVCVWMDGWMCNAI